MKEAIIKLTSDHIKVKGGEYVRDYPHGYWTKVSADKYVQHAMCFYRCSECGSDVIGEQNFCPNCGAQMDKEKGKTNEKGMTNEAD